MAVWEIRGLEVRVVEERGGKEVVGMIMEEEWKREAATGPKNRE